MEQKNEENEIYKNNPPDTRDLTRKYLKGVWVHKNDDSEINDTLIFADIDRLYYTDEHKNELLNGNGAGALLQINRLKGPIGTVKLFQITIRKKNGYPGVEHTGGFSEPHDRISIGVNDVSFYDEERMHYFMINSLRGDSDSRIKFTNYNRLVLNDNDVYTRLSEDWIYQKKEGWALNFSAY